MLGERRHSQSILHSAEFNQFHIKLRGFKVLQFTMNILPLICIYLLSQLAGTKSTITGNEKNSCPESTAGQIAEGEFSETAWPMFHSGSGGIEDILLGGPSQQAPEVNQNLQQKKQMAQCGTSGCAARTNAPQAQQPIGQPWHNFEQDYDHDQMMPTATEPQAQHGGGLEILNQNTQPIRQFEPDLNKSLQRFFEGRKKRLQQRVAHPIETHGLAQNMQLENQTSYSKLSGPELSILYRESGGLEDIFRTGASKQTPVFNESGPTLNVQLEKEMTGGGTSDSAASSNTPQAPNFAITGKSKANEMEKQQQPGTWREGQGQPADITGTAVMAPIVKNRIHYRYDDSIAKQFKHVTKSAQGDGSFYCTACKRDYKVSTMGTQAAIVGHQNSDMHKNAAPQKSNKQMQKTRTSSNTDGGVDDEKNIGIRKEIPAPDEKGLGMAPDAFDDLHSIENDDLFSVVKPYVRDSDRFLAGSSKRKLMSTSLNKNHNETKINEFGLTLEELRRCAQPQAWFGNEIIDTYLAMLIAQNPSFGHLPAYEFDEFKRNNIIVKNWADQIDLGQTSRFFVPLHINGNHWALGLMDMQWNIFHVFDSRNHGDRVEYTKNVTKDPIQSAVVYTKNESVYFAIRYFEELYKLNARIIEHIEIPQQENDIVCGVFTVMYAYYIVTNKGQFDMDKFTQEAVNKFRQKVVTEVEITELAIVQLGSNEIVVSTQHNHHSEKYIIVAESEAHYARNKDGGFYLLNGGYVYEQVYNKWVCNEFGCNGKTAVTSENRIIYISEHSHPPNKEYGLTFANGVLPDGWEELSPENRENIARQKVFKHDGYSYKYEDTIEKGLIHYACSHNHNKKDKRCKARRILKDGFFKLTHKHNHEKNL